MKCDSCGKRGLGIVKWQTEDGQIHVLGENDGTPHTCLKLLPPLSYYGDSKARPSEDPVLWLDAP